MKFLLDTNVFLWFLSGDARLPAAWRDTIRQPHPEVSLSVVSLWETIMRLVPWAAHTYYQSVNTVIFGGRYGKACWSTDSNAVSAYPA